MIEEADLSGSGIILKNRCVFRFTGPDRVRYLNGQVTNDLTKDLEQQAVPACVCSIKGKVEAIIWISSDEDSLIVDGELSQRDSLHERLDRYLIADDCEIEDVTDQLQLHHHFLPDLGGVAGRRSRFSGFDRWLGPDETAPQESNVIADHLFELAQLQALIPRAGYEVTGAEFPAELGLDRWAVDFHKGCYLGQEIVSRIESVGRVKRGLRLLVHRENLPACAEIRNSFGEIGKTTGPALFSEEKRYFTLGLFDTGRDAPQTLGNQPLECELIDSSRS